MHVHSKNSHDGKLPIGELVQIAKERGVDYLIISDHCDYDLQYGGCKCPVRYRYLDLPSTYEEWKKAKQALDSDKNSTLNLLFGIEAAFCESKASCEKYAEVIAKYPFDAVINSVHCVNGQETYFRNYFFFKSKEKAYGDYLDTVLKSLDAPYPYEIVAHIGYITHGAPYRDKTFRYSEFPDKIDAILKGIIDRGKVLEVNCHHDICPPTDVLQRYFELGGRKVSYGGDSHRGEICERFDEVSKMLKEIGFTHYSVFKQHQEILIPIV